jgi:hypothetical protein
MRTIRSRGCASLVLVTFLTAVLLTPSGAAAKYRDRSGDLPFGGGTGILLVVVGVSAVAVVTLLIIRSQRAKGTPPAATPQTSDRAVLQGAAASSVATELILRPVDLTETGPGEPAVTVGAAATASLPDLHLSALTLARVVQAPALDLQTVDAEPAAGASTSPELPAGMAGAVAVAF